MNSKMNTQANELIIGIAQQLNSFMGGNEFEWESVFLRFVGDRSSKGTEMIFKIPNDEEGLIPRLSHPGRRELIANVKHLFCDLQDEIEKEKGIKFYVAVLKLNRDLSYDIYFEYNDMNKWALDLMDGKTGIPDLEN